MILSERFDAALQYAAQAHRHQQRKGSGIPYLAHLLAVASLAIEYGADEDQAIAALLHDVIEDCGSEHIPQLRSQFGERVLALVEGCTDSYTFPKPDWHTRKNNYLAHLALAPTELLLISACDKLHNLRSIVQDYQQVGEAIWDRFSGGKIGSLWYYQSLSALFAQSALPADLKLALAQIWNELQLLSTS